MSGGKDASQPTPPTYNVSSSDSGLVDKEKKDYPEIPDNEIGATNLANKSVLNTTTSGGVAVGIPQNTQTGDGNMALVTIPVVVILGIILITLTATIYLVSKRSKVKKRPVKEIVSIFHIYIKMYLGFCVRSM